MALHHVALRVRDLQRAEAFYTAVLGLRVERRWQDHAGEPRSVWLDLGGGPLLMLERAPSAAIPGALGWHMIALTIARSEREAIVERLSEQGVSVVAETDYTVYIQDPEGNRVGLSHWPDAA
jgi:catechol 2,3-dioxygenase-like lactoylglutathione lyase family enzyme